LDLTITVLNECFTPIVVFLNRLVGNSPCLGHKIIIAAIFTPRVNLQSVTQLDAAEIFRIPEPFFRTIT